MTVQRTQREIPSSEFTEWIAYLDEEPNRFHREDYYLAQIASEIRKPNAKDPELVEPKHFLIKFTSKKAKKMKNSWKHKAASARGFFGALIATYRGKR